ISEDLATPEREDKAKDAEAERDGLCASRAPSSRRWYSLIFATYAACTYCPRTMLASINNNDRMNKSCNYHNIPFFYDTCYYIASIPQKACHKTPVRSCPHYLRALDVVTGWLRSTLIASTGLQTRIPCGRAALATSITA